MAFAFLDENPCKTPRTRNHAWEVITADNAELFFWPVDVDAGYVTVASGLMVRTMGGGYQISDSELVIKPPLDLHMPLGPQSADAMCLDAVYGIAPAPSGGQGVPRSVGLSRPLAICELASGEGGIRRTRKARSRRPGAGRWFRSRLKSYSRPWPVIVGPGRPEIATLTLLCVHDHASHLPFDPRITTRSRAGTTSTTCPTKPVPDRCDPQRPELAGWPARHLQRNDHPEEPA